jgi:hypothetical protein
MRQKYSKENKRCVLELEGSLEIDAEKQRN